MIAIPGPTGQPRGNVGMLWQYTGLLLLKPSLMVIGMIFGWYFSVLSIFFINMTFFGVMGSVFSSNDGSFLVDLLDLIMFYLVYLVIVFIALKHSFSIISSFPQTVSDALELRGHNDSRTISSVGAEQLLSLMIVNKVKDAVTQSISNVGEAGKELMGTSNRQKIERQQIQQARQEAAQRANQRFDDLEEGLRDKNNSQATKLEDIFDNPDKPKQ